MVEVNRNSSKTLFLVSLLLGLVLLVPAFYKNQWSVVQRTTFERYQEDSAALVYGGIAHTDRHGLGKSRFGLWAMQDGDSMWENPNWVESTRSVFFSGAPVGKWMPYVSQIGLHGWVYAVLYKIFPIAPATFAKILEILNSALLAISISIIVWWICRLGHWCSPLILIAVMAFSPWLTQIARNVYWAPWTWLLPMIVAIFINLNGRNTEKPVSRSLEFTLLSLAVFIKSACGYEYISYVLVCMMLPYFVTVVHNTTGWKSIPRRFAVPVVAGLTGFAAAILVNAIQKASLFEIADGLAAIWSDVIRRTAAIGDTSSFSTIIVDSLRVPVSDVLRIYTDTIVLVLPGKASISAMAVLIVVALSWVLYFMSARIGRQIVVARSVAAVGVAATLAATAPLSWFILAKGHSYIHQPINPVLWVVPLLPLTIAFLSLTISQCLKKFNVEQKSAFETGVIAVMAVIATQSIYFDLNTAIRMRLPDSVRTEANAANQNPTTVFLNGVNLTVVAKNASTFEADTRFFVHVYPMDVQQLPLESRQFGFHNLDFEPNQQQVPVPRWSVYSSDLIFQRRIPSTYRVNYIEVGQYKMSNGQRLWSVRL